MERSFRYDYAKLFITGYITELQKEYEALVTAATALKGIPVGFASSHKVTPFRSDGAGSQTWIIDIWGEWSEVVEQLDPLIWMPRIRRLDVRAIEWDADGEAVLTFGQLIQRHYTAFNTHVFNSKVASKRQGRDRGGQGFAIGSHKSDLRITVYKRGTEPVAIEHQCQGAMLSRFVKQALEAGTCRQGPWLAEWIRLRKMVENVGNLRFTRAVEACNVGVYWPTRGSVKQVAGAAEFEGQLSFAAPLSESFAFDATAEEEEGQEPEYDFIDPNDVAD